jgi:hypothetical protein
MKKIGKLTGSGSNDGPDFEDFGDPDLDENGQPTFRDGCDFHGIPRAKYGNTRAAIRALKVKIQFNAFTQRVVIAGIEAQNDMVPLLRSRVYDVWGFNPKETDVKQAVTYLARKHTFNPVVTG